MLQAPSVFALRVPPSSVEKKKRAQVEKRRNSEQLAEGFDEPSAEWTEARGVCRRYVNAAARRGHALLQNARQRFFLGANIFHKNLPRQLFFRVD